MAAMTQLNTRIDSEVKRRGDAVFARAGLTPSQVVRAVWQYAADTQEVPDIVLPRNDPNEQRRIEAVSRGATVVAHMARDMGFDLTGIEPEPFDYKTYRDQMYDEMIREMEANHVGS